MVIKTEDLEEQLNELLLTVYGSMQLKYIFFTIAAFVLYIIVPLFIIQVLKKYEKELIENGKKPKAYIFAPTVNLSTYNILLIFLGASAIYEFFKSINLVNNSTIYDKWLIILTSVFIVLGALTIISLRKFKIKGLFLLGLYIAYYAIYKQLLLILKSMALIEFAQNASVIDRYGIYAYVNYFIRECYVISGAAIVTVILLTIYYYRFRYIFMPGKLQMPICSDCGKPILKGESYCTYCGAKVENKDKGIDITSLDNDRHCSKCGLPPKLCVCENKKPLGKAVKSGLKDGLSSWLKNGASFICVIVVAVIPHLSSALLAFQQNSALVNNAFIAKYNELYDNPEKALDSEWLIGFDSSLNGLYAFDLKWAKYDINKLKYHELNFFWCYANASFNQMSVLEDIYKFTHELGASKADINSQKNSVDLLGERMNKTINVQSYSMTLYGSWHTSSMVEKAEHMFCDAAMFYMSAFDITIIAWIFIGLSFAMLIFILSKFNKTSDKSAALAYYEKIKKANVYVNNWLTINSVSSQKSIIYNFGILLIEILAVLGCLIFKAVFLCMVIVAALLVFLSLFRPSAISRCALWYKKCFTDIESQNYIITDKQREFKKRERITSVIAGCIIIAIFAINMIVIKVSFNVGNNISTVNEDEYLSVAYNALISYSVDISNYLLIINNDMMTKEDMIVFLNLCDDQIAADQLLLDFDEEKLADYADIHSELCSICKDDIIAVQKIKDSVQNGMRPSYELQKSYAELRGKDYVYALCDILWEYTKKSYDIF